MGTDDTLDERIAAFLDGDTFAVVGASADRSKYGNIVLRRYMALGRRVHPVNPRGGTIEGLTAHATLADVPEQVHAASIVTPPEVTESVVEEAAAAGVKHLWMQPGAEFPGALERCRALGISCIAGDACVLVVLGNAWPERGADR